MLQFPPLQHVQLFFGAVFIYQGRFAVIWYKIKRPGDLTGISINISISISVSVRIRWWFGSQEFNIEKLQLLEAEKSKIRKDFERREGQIDVKKKIDFSKQLNASRIKVLLGIESEPRLLCKTRGARTWNLMCSQILHEQPLNYLLTSSSCTAMHL